MCGEREREEGPPPPPISLLQTSSFFRPFSLHPRQIPDVFTLRLAAFAAATARAAGRARTRSPYTELVVCLSGGKNVR